MPAKAKVDLSFKEISERMRACSLPAIDLVVGIARGGIVPASMLAHQLGCPCTLISINYRDDANKPRYELPRFLQDNVPQLAPDQRLLLVDDVSVSGKTLTLAKELLNHPHTYTFTLKGKADFVLFPEVASCVNWPWNVPVPKSH